MYRKWDLSAVCGIGKSVSTSGLSLAICAAMASSGSWHGSDGPGLGGACKKRMLIVKDRGVLGDCEP